MFQVLCNLIVFYVQGLSALIDGWMLLLGTGKVSLWITISPIKSNVSTLFIFQSQVCYCTVLCRFLVLLLLYLLYYCSVVLLYYYSALVILYVYSYTNYVYSNPNYVLNHTICTCTACFAIGVYKRHPPLESMCCIVQYYTAIVGPRTVMFQYLGKLMVQGYESGLLLTKPCSLQIPKRK